MTNQYVLDASALIALLKSEPGAELVSGALSCSIVSAVNLAEVGTKLADYAMSTGEIEFALAKFMSISFPFDTQQALQTGFLRSQTRDKGLSLGDRACLALAKTTGRTALTADRAWADLDVGVTIELIR